MREGFGDDQESGRNPVVAACQHAGLVGRGQASVQRARPGDAQARQRSAPVAGRQHGGLHRTSDRLRGQQGRACDLPAAPGPQGRHAGAPGRSGLQPALVARRQPDLLPVLAFGPQPAVARSRQWRHAGAGHAFSGGCGHLQALARRHARGPDHGRVHRLHHAPVHAQAPGCAQGRQGHRTAVQEAVRAPLGHLVGRASVAAVRGQPGWQRECRRPAGARQSRHRRRHSLQAVRRQQ